MLDSIFSELPRCYIKHSFTTPTSYYFSIDDKKMTVLFDEETCTVKHGKAVESADCVCKTSEDLFLKIWLEGYVPGMGDFLKGNIKSNTPHLLQQFMKAFGKN